MTTHLPLVINDSTSVVSEMPAGDSLPTSALPSNTIIMPIGLLLDGGGSAITTGLKGQIRVPVGCTIQDIQLIADQSGSIQIDIWKVNYSSYAATPTSANSICASALPTISSAIKAQDSTLTGWTKTIAADDYLFFNVVSCSAITRCSVVLKAVKT